MVQAAAALGYTITVGDLDRAKAEMESLDPEEMAKAAGGRYETVFYWSDYRCLLNSKGVKVS